jgi:hypothetical protein
MVLTLTDEDLNGECFILGSEGEREDINVLRNVCLPTDIANIPANILTSRVPAARAWWNLFVVTNYEDQVAHGVNARDARRVAYIRLLAAREGFFKWSDTPGQHNVRYSEFVVRAAVGDDVADWDQDDAWRRNVLPKLYDIVCIMAYFFRVRAHHWTDAMNERYSAVWNKCQYEEENPGLSWQLICHNALHAIYPDDLDDIWLQAADIGRCAGALKKRINSMPAGVAGISALNAGVSDLKLVVPAAFNHLKEAIAHLEDLTRLTLGSGNRWNGSVNRRFYGAADVRVNEALLGAVAALILAACEQFAPNSPLRKSMALKRIADNAQLTGAVIARMVKVAVSSDAAAEIFLPEAPPASAPAQP